MKKARVFALLVLCLLLTDCASLRKETGTQASAFFLKKTEFSALPGWGSDNPAESLPALQKSCAVVAGKDSGSPIGFGGYAGTGADWTDVCSKLSLYLLATQDEARGFFENNFAPYEIYGDSGRDGLFTGYYEPVLHGSRKKKKPYLIPLYGRPADLVSVNLGDFRPELKGETVAGRVQGENLVPYYSRAEIEKGALKKQRKEIVYVDNAVDAFFLHIQGSGQVVMKNRKILHIGYAAQNGRPYEAIGRALVQRGELTKENVSMQSIRSWLESHPDQAAEVMNINASYVFFRKLKEDGPLGAQGVPLTPRRSLAVDRKKIPYGVPVFIDAENPGEAGRLQRLMIAQDTGGAIRGAVRGDFFWGAGPEAAEKAGIMKSQGQSWILLPRTVIVPDVVLKKPWWMAALDIFKGAQRGKLND